MGIFYSALTFDNRGGFRRRGLQCVIEAFGEEHVVGYDSGESPWLAWAPRFLNWTHPAPTKAYYSMLGVYSSDVYISLENPPPPILAVHKIINPFKWFMFLVGWFYHTVDYLTLTLLTHNNDSYTIGTLSITNNPVRVIVRFLIVTPLEYIYRFTRASFSPINHILCPFFQYLGELWGAEGHHRDIAGGLFNNILLGRIWAPVLLLMTLFLTGFVIGSIVTAGGLPLFGALSATIYAGISYVAGFSFLNYMGGSLYVYIAASIGSLFASMAVTRLISEGFFPTIMDIVSGLMGYKGYSKDQAIISLKTGTFCERVGHDHKDKNWDEPAWRVDEEKPDSFYGNSWAFAFLAFGADIRAIPRYDTKPISVKTSEEDEDLLDLLYIIPKRQLEVYDSESTMKDLEPPTKNLETSSCLSFFSSSKPNYPPETLPPQVSPLALGFGLRRSGACSE